jgi:hypothetical protein
LRSVRLFAARSDLLDALRVLGTNRRRRFSSIVPIWLRYYEDNQELTLTEENARVQATVSATGTWPAAGATISLFYFRRAVTNSAERVELHATESAILVPTTHGHVALDLLTFGPKLERPAPKPPVDHHSDLPIFSHKPVPNHDPVTWDRRLQFLLSRCEYPLALRAADEIFQFEHTACMGSSASVRIARKDDSITLAAVRATFLSRTIVRKRLTMQDWTLLTTTVNSTGFWSMPEHHENAGLDGYTWSIAGRTADRYNRSECWMPFGPFGELGSLFVQLAGIELPQDQP